MRKIFVLPPDHGKANPAVAHYSIFLLLFLFVLGCLSAYYFVFSKRVFVPEKLLNSEAVYLDSVYRDTWKYLSEYVNPDTGLPYDSSAKQPVTSISNIGLYLAAVSAAFETGLISEEEAERRVAQTLKSILKMEHWRGIPRPWVLVRTLKPAHGEEFSYASHLAAYLGGLITVKNALPQFQPRIDKMLRRMDLKSLFDGRTGWIKGGYNVQNQNFAVFQPWGHWYHKFFASEVRLLAFYMIASDAAPVQLWFSLVRPKKNENGFQFYASDYEEAGILSRYLPSLFLKERHSTISESQREYARFQMNLAKTRNAPVWGWASSEDMRGRYMSEDEIKSEIVTPYASILSALYFPKQAIKNLRRLERLGARPAVAPSGETYGFIDAVNWKAKETAPHYLTAHQAAIFLALANVLHEGIVWNIFGSDPVVKRGFEILEHEF